MSITRSFGSSGDCYDNSAVEAIWATLKRELHWMDNKWRVTTIDRLAKSGDLVGSVLDPGCGTGEHALLAVSLGHEVVG